MVGAFVGFNRPAPKLCSSCVSDQYPPLNADMPRWTEVPHFKSHHDYLNKLQLPNLLTPVEMAFPQRRRWQSRLCFPRRDCLFPEARGKSGRQVAPPACALFLCPHHNAANQHTINRMDPMAVKAARRSAVDTSSDLKVRSSLRSNNPRRRSLDCCRRPRAIKNIRRSVRDSL